MPAILDRALLTYGKIKRSLVMAILDPTAADVEAVRSDRLCEFGQWIYGEGTRFCGRADFHALKTTPMKFHRAAFMALCRCREGRRDLAVESIEHGEFALQSEEMKRRLITLRNTLAEPQGKLTGAGSG